MILIIVSRIANEKITNYMDYFKNRSGQKMILLYGSVILPCNYLTCNEAPISLPSIGI